METEPDLGTIALLAAGMSAISVKLVDGIISFAKRDKLQDLTVSMAAVRKKNHELSNSVLRLTELLHDLSTEHVMHTGRLNEICDITKKVHDMHEVYSGDGVRAWYFPRTELLASIKDLEYVMKDIVVREQDIQSLLNRMLEMENKVLDVLASIKSGDK